MEKNLHEGEPKMSLLSAFGCGVLIASAFIMWCGDLSMVIGCVVGVGAIITDLLLEAEKEQK